MITLDLSYVGERGNQNFFDGLLGLCLLGEGACELMKKNRDVPLV